MVMSLNLFYADPVMERGKGAPYAEIEIPSYSHKTLDYYKQFHCLNCSKLKKCKLRKLKPMKEPEKRFYTCSLFDPQKPIEKPKLTIENWPSKERLKELAWALEVAMQK